MDQCLIGKTGIKANRLALGTWSMGGDEKWGSQNDEISLNAIQTAINNGINVIDTAPAYGFGHSEKLVGKAIRSIPRDNLIIQTKCGFWWKDDEGTFFLKRDGRICRRNLSRRAIFIDVEDSLKNLGIDYIDVYITHHQAREPFLVPIEETMDALLDLKKQGKIRAIGISNCSLDEINKYLACGTIDVLQEKFSMLDQDKLFQYLPICEKNQITFEAFSPLEQGLLSGNFSMSYQVPKGNLRNDIRWYKPEKRQLVINMLSGWNDLLEKYQCNQANLTIAWTLSQVDNMIVLGGGRKQEHVLDYIKGADIKLSAEDKSRMDNDIRSLLLKEKEMNVV